jgi:hypothetical protein
LVVKFLGLILYKLGSEILRFNTVQAW